MSSFKLVFVFSVLAAVSVRNVRAVTAEEKEKIHAAAIPHLLKCSVEFGVTVEDMKKAKESDNWSSVDPCLMACVFKDEELIDDKGFFNSDKAEEFTKEYLSDKDDQKKANGIISDCKSVNDHEVTDGEKGCERAALLFECFLSFKDMAVSSEDKQKIHVAMIPHIAACSSVFGVTEDDIKTAKEAGKLGALDSCLMGCAFKKIEVINDKGLFDFDKAEGLSKNFLSEDADQKKGLEVINTCKAVNERDVTDGEKGCERAGFLLECFIPFKDTFIH